MMKKLSLSSFSLHLLAMALMLTDHLRFVLPDAELILCAVGRLAFPLFAFMISEGIAHTKNIKKYLLRLLLLAVISEIPFDLMLYKTAFSPEHQNVIWTFLIAVIAVVCCKRYSARSPRFFIPAAAVLIAELSRFDYGGLGVLTVFLFCSVGREDRLRLSIGFILINAACAALYSAWIQLLAVLSLPLVFMYKGERGADGRLIRLCFYGFYPVHMLILRALM